MTQTRPKSRRTRGWYVIRWIELHCVHTQGRWIGKPFRLLAWQKALILALFAVDPATGLRIYRWALIGVPKKNGKTELAAALGLYFLIGDGELSPLVACAASADEQADLVFGAARTMCEMSPSLSQITEVFEKEIIVPSIPGAKLVRLAAAVGTKDGPSWFVVICDELHEWTGPKGEGMWNVLTNGVGAREQPMIIQLTTAGHDVEGTICGRLYSDGMKVAAGEKDDPTFFFYWWQAPEGMDYRDPETWRLANPSFGLILGEAFYRDQLAKKTEAIFRRYFLNQWTESEEIWEVAQFWPMLKRDRLRFDKKAPLYVGIDVSRRHDGTAVVKAQRYRKRLVAVQAKIWENPYGLRDRRHHEWRISMVDVESYLRELYETFEAWTRGEPGPAFFYDPKFMIETAPRLERDGLNMVEYPQSDQRMAPASQTFYEFAVGRLIVHDGDSAFSRHIRNVVPDQTAYGEWRISRRNKKNSTKHIDAAVAAAIAVHECVRPAEEDEVADLAVSFV